jgi:predicted dehydrogenase
MEAKVMKSELKVAIIGLDTSHSVAMPKLMNDPACPEDMKVSGMRAVTCLRFETPFQGKSGLDSRQAQLEGWGVKVTGDFDEAVADCDAIMLEINDPSYHLEYFRRVCGLGKPVFLDKPLASKVKEGREILKLAREHKVRVWSGSSLPFSPALLNAKASLGEDPIIIGTCYGAMGEAPAGDSLIWYGVHSFEMLQALMGCGAQRVHSLDNGVSIVTSVEYADGRRGLIESIRGLWAYGGRMQTKGRAVPFQVDSSRLYYDLLLRVREFFLGGDAPVSMEQTFEGLAMMEAARKSLTNGGAVACEAL